MARSNRLRGALAAVVAAGMLASWGVASPARADESVTYLLPAPPFLPAFGPWMVAQQRGYYKAAGLDVHFQIAQGGVDVAKQVGVGNAVIGGGIGDTPIIVRANGIPVKAVAILGGQGLAFIVVPKDSPIKGPAGLKGKTMTVMSYQDTTYYTLLGALSTVGLNKSDVNIQAAGPANTWKLFLAGKVSAMAGVPDWIGNVEAAGMKVRFMPVNKYFPSMAQSILASDDVIKTKPDLIRKLVQATLHGMKDIMANPQAAAVDYVKAVPQNKAHEAQMAKVFAMYDKYVYPGQKVVGMVDPKRMADVQNFYLKEGFIQKATPVSELYTNEFVK